MRRTFLRLAATLAMLGFGGVLLAQSVQPSSSQSAPRLITINGVFHPADGQPVSRVEGVTLAIYADETGGVPLWQETQSIELDSGGRVGKQLCQLRHRSLSLRNGAHLDPMAQEHDGDQRSQLLPERHPRVSKGNGRAEDEGDRDRQSY